MKRAIVVLAALATLIGCGGPATPDLNTPAGYRQGVLTRAERAVGIVNAAQASCADGSLDQCRQALRTQEARLKQQPELEPTDGYPLVCDRLAHDYFILLNGAHLYLTAFCREV